MEEKKKEKQNRNTCDYYHGALADALLWHLGVLLAFIGYLACALLGAVDEAPGARWSRKRAGVSLAGSGLDMA
jgi:hypothetical protein